jgi:hypothetical protein
MSKKMLSAKVSNYIAPAGHPIAFTSPDKYLDYYCTILTGGSVTHYG